MSQWYCYILRSTVCNSTYNGMTNDPTKRLRQHNGEIKGGAKMTSKYRPWEMYVLVTGFPNKCNTLSCEWRIKHPDNKRRRGKKYCGHKGRILGLAEVLRLEQWTQPCVDKNCDMQLTVWITEEYADLLTDLPKNITVIIHDFTTIPKK